MNVLKWLWGPQAKYDRSLLLAAVLLAGIGAVLISSASVMEAQIRYGDGMFYLKKHLITLGIAVICWIFATTIPTNLWRRYALHILALIIGMLILTLFVGKEVNNAKRWLSLGFFNIQTAEFLKLAWIFYLSSYASRKVEEVREQYKGFLKPFLFIALFVILLLMQPDFGSLVVVTVIMLGILMAAGARIFKLIAVALFSGTMGALLVITQPYRMRRWTSFLHPWQDEFGSGYQLTQSLMAFGRGGVTGEGLGNSIQKLGYLPEAHTDFVTAILGEEFGFVGMLVLIALEFFIVFKAMRLGLKILRGGAFFQGYLAYGIGIWFCLQTTINIGVASGGLPTKGLTLPLVSFGGSSLMVCFAAVGILLRVSYEFKNHAFGVNDLDGEDLRRT